MGRKIINIITFLMSLLLLSCGSGGGTDSTTPIVFKNNSGPVSPDFVYQETTTITYDVMEIDRTGGSKVIVGHWKVTITQDEATELNRLRGLINPVADSDIVSDSGPIGGGPMEMHINDNVTFHDGYLYDEATSSYKYHAFSANVKNLADYINTLLRNYGYDQRVTVDA